MLRAKNKTARYFHVNLVYENIIITEYLAPILERFYLPVNEYLTGCA